MELVFDLDKWGYSEFYQFIKSSSEADYRLASNLLAKVIVSWSFEGDPKNPETIGGLTITSFRQVCGVITKEGMEMLKNSAENKTEGFEVDVDGWTTFQNQDYIEATQTGDAEVISKLLPLIVVKWPYSYKIDSSAVINFSFETFCEVTGAVNREFAANFSEGN